MSERQQFGSKRHMMHHTVPEIRMALSELLAVTCEDASLFEPAQHIRRAIKAIDDARAMALAVMREAEAEVPFAMPTQSRGASHRLRKLC